MSSFFVPHIHSMMPKSQMRPPLGLLGTTSSLILVWFSEVAVFPESDGSALQPAAVCHLNTTLLLLGATLLWPASLRPDVCASMSQSKRWSRQPCFSSPQPQQLGTLLTVPCWCSAQSTLVAIRAALFSSYFLVFWPHLRGLPLLFDKVVDLHREGFPYSPSSQESFWMCVPLGRDCRTNRSCPIPKCSHFLSSPRPVGIYSFS